MKNLYIKVLLISLLSSNILNGQGWQQIGTEIFGNESNDKAGKSVSINAGGNIVAVGAPFNGTNNNGHVKVYQANGFLWQQIGADIVGLDNEQFGTSVCLSSDASIVACGGIDIIRVYENISGTWTQLGGDILPEVSTDGIGGAISLSSDGAILAVGGSLNDGAATDAGHVRVFEYVSGNWIQIGNDIDGEEVNEQFGSSVSLNSEGSILCVGAIGYVNYTGQVKVYENISGTWTQVGNSIIGGGENDQSGSAVAINDEGDILVVGSPYADAYPDNDCGIARVYENIAGTWTQIGDNINGGFGQSYLGNAVDINSDGSVIAIGEYRAHTYPIPAILSTGQIKVLRNNGGAWSQIGADIKGENEWDEFGYSVAINSIGTKVIGGAQNNDGNGSESGHARVFLTPLTVVTIQPSDQTDVCPSETSVQFYTEGTNFSSYQWQVSVDNGSNWSDISNGATYSGTETNTLTVAVEGDLDYNQYRCEVNGSIYTDGAILAFETIPPTIICMTNQERYDGTTNGYTVIEDEFDPFYIEDNCGIAYVENDFNNTSTLAGEQIPDGVTTIEWTIVDDAGNYNTCTFDIIINDYVDIETLNLKGISIYPNPTNGIVNFDFAEENIKNLIISDITGKRLIEKNETQQNESIDLSDLNSGIYIVSIQTENGVCNTRIVKK